MPCVTVPLNLLETGGTSVRRVRLPVKACRRPSNYLAPSFLLLRFKDFASNHEHGRVKSFASQRAIGKRHSLHLRILSSRKSTASRRKSLSGNLFCCFQAAVLD